MEFAEFILAHDGDNLGALALARDRYVLEVEDFDLALTTLEVRRKLRYKVPEWYAEPSLRYPFRLSGEQCSSSETASYKASLAGQGNVADLTGGLGVDSWAFAGCAKEVLYNEMQPELCAAAQHNFRELGLKNVVVRNYTVIPSSVIPSSVIPSSVIPAFSSVIPSEASVSHSATIKEILNGFEPDIIFLDPARRSSDGRKVFRLEDCSPNVLALRDELLGLAPRLLLKLSPMADISLVCKQLGSVKEVHVVAADGECKELLLLLERGYEGDYATVIYENGSVMEGGTEGDVLKPMATLGRTTPKINSFSGGPDSYPSRGPSVRMGGVAKRRFENITLRIGLSLFEPGKALLKAGAFELPCRFGLTKLGKHTHLYVGESVPEELKPFGKCFKILEVLPLNNKTIKDIAKRYPQASVTARNIPLSSDQLRKKLGVKDGGTVHIFGVHVDASGGNYLVAAN
ncbi:MAG: hypothetical protein IK052_07170 [Bacteroidales bacterium]|nr:hypothetical protein [Bacteroidales bacterium]